MALSLQTKTANIGTPSATTQTFSHVTNSGSNRYMYLIIAMSNAVDFSSVTYNGVAMTLAETRRNTTSTSTYWAIYTLANPNVGTNNVVITFSAGQFNPVSSWASSWTDSSGIGNIVFTDTAVSPSATTIAFSANSQLVGAEVSGVSTGNVITFNGGSPTLEFTHNINNFTSLAVKTGGLGSSPCTVSVASVALVAGYYFEVKEFTGGGGSTQGLMMMF